VDRQLTGTLSAAAEERTRAALRTARAAADPLLAFVSLMAALGGLLEDAGATARAASPAHNQDYRRIDCRKGCTACCYIPLAVTVVEAVAAAARASTDAATLARVRAAAEQQLSAAERWRQRLPCVLLRDRECTIYAHRPLPCRAYVSVDVRRCDAALASGDSGELLAVPTLDLPREHAAALRSGIRAACNAEGVQDAHVELGPAIALLLDEPEAVRRWLSGARVFNAPAGGMGG
jgi:Fe-S-cluster containining protein